MQRRELLFRQHLISVLAGKWIVTIHNENHLCPGTPDLSFVMIGATPDRYETGWIELKSVLPTKTLRIKVEYGQHRWMRQHSELIPSFFLIECGTVCVLVHGRHHDDLTGLTCAQLQTMGTTFSLENLPLLANTLREFTKK